MITLGQILDSSLKSFNSFFSYIHPHFRRKISIFCKGNVRRTVRPRIVVNTGSQVDALPMIFRMSETKVGTWLRIRVTPLFLVRKHLACLGLLGNKITHYVDFINQLVELLSPRPAFLKTLIVDPTSVNSFRIKFYTGPQKKFFFFWFDRRINNRKFTRGRRQPSKEGCVHG